MLGAAVRNAHTAAAVSPGPGCGTTGSKKAQVRAIAGNAYDD